MERNENPRNSLVKGIVVFWAVVFIFGGIFALASSSNNAKEETTSYATASSAASNKKTSTTNKKTSTTNKNSTRNTATNNQTQKTEEKPKYDKNGKRVTRKFKWDTMDGGYAWISISLNVEEYKYYASLDRELSHEKMISTYIQDERSQAILDSLVKGFRDVQNQLGWSDERLLAEAGNMVQQTIEYEKDSKHHSDHYEYPKYIIETLYDKTGDCEDTAMLMAGIIRKLGYGSGLVFMPGHCATVVKGDSSVKGRYYEKNNARYYYWESTGSNWKIGKVPKKFKKKKATDVYVF